MNMVAHQNETTGLPISSVEVSIILEILVSISVRSNKLAFLKI
jgi:hypothetical protein